MSFFYELYMYVFERQFIFLSVRATNNDLTQWEKLELNTNPNALPGQQLSVAGVPCI